MRAQYSWIALWYTFCNHKYFNLEGYWLENIKLSDNYKNVDLKSWMFQSLEEEEKMTQDQLAVKNVGKQVSVLLAPIETVSWSNNIQ